MKCRALLFAVVFLGVVAMARAEDKPADPVAQGKALVEKYKCSMCHAIDGKGGKIGKPMNGITEGKTDDYLHGALTDPKKTIGPDTKMISYKEKLKDDEVKAVIEYIKTLKKQ
jgi:cytochrome c553